MYPRKYLRANLHLNPNTSLRAANPVKPNTSLRTRLCSHVNQIFDFCTRVVLIYPAVLANVLHIFSELVCVHAAMCSDCGFFGHCSLLVRCLPRGVRHSNPQTALAFMPRKQLPLETLSDKGLAILCNGVYEILSAHSHLLCHDI